MSTTNPQQCCCGHVLRAEISKGDQKRGLYQQYGQTIPIHERFQRVHFWFITHPICVEANDEAQLGVGDRGGRRIKIPLARVMGRKPQNTVHKVALTRDLGKGKTQCGQRQPRIKLSWLITGIHVCQLNRQCPELLVTEIAR